MRITPLLTICLCYLIAATAVWGQAPSTSTNPGVLGYLDPRTGAFRPIPQLAAEDADIAAASTFGGTITLTITVTLKTPAITAVTCTAQVTVVDNPAVSPTTFGEINTVAATGSNPKTCKLTIPYSWALATQSTDTMSINYSVFGAVGTTGLPQRTATRVPLVNLKVPANGAPTTLTAAVTL